MHKYRLDCELYTGSCPRCGMEHITSSNCVIICDCTEEFSMIVKEIN